MMKEERKGRERKKLQSVSFYLSFLFYFIFILALFIVVKSDAADSIVPLSLSTIQTDKRSLLLRESQSALACSLANPSQTDTA